MSKSGFYDGLIFHRVIPGFMIQGGDPKGIGMGGPGYCINGEFKANGFQNNSLASQRGVLSMARTMAPNSAGSQFFIMHEDAPHLDGQYAAFGKVIEGIEEVDKICSVRTDYNDKPRIPQVMKKVTVDTSRRRLSRTGKRIIHLPYPYFLRSLQKSESWAFTFERSIDTAGFPNEFIA